MLPAQLVVARHVDFQPSRLPSRTNLDLHLGDYRLGRELSKYLSRRKLQFIPFDPAWVLDCETLDCKTVVEYVERSFADALGEIPEAELPPYEKMISENRKVVRAFANKAKPLLGRGAVRPMSIFRMCARSERLGRLSVCARMSACLISSWWTCTAYPLCASALALVRRRRPPENPRRRRLPSADGTAKAYAVHASWILGTGDT